jgi:hypothetical protein
MKNRALAVLLMSALPLMVLSCKRGESRQPPEGTQGELQEVFPNSTAAPQVQIPQGKGMLTVLVEDEKGSPIQGAEIRISNNKGETFKTTSRKDGTTKGAGSVSENPFVVTVMLAGYEAQQVQGIALSEGRPVFIKIRLRRAGK